MIIFCLCASSYESEEKDDDIPPLIATDKGLMVFGLLYDFLMINMSFNLKFEMYMLIVINLVISFYHYLCRLILIMTAAAETVISKCIR